MIGSSTPLAEQPDWHPVHRANAMLRAALLSSTHPSEPAEDLPNVESLSRAIESVMEGPVSITYPTSLAARLDALAVEDEFPAFEGLMSGAPRRFLIPEVVQTSAMDCGPAALKCLAEFRVRQNSHGILKSLNLRHCAFSFPYPVTFTEQNAALPSNDATIVALPGFTARTNPRALTVQPAFRLDHVAKAVAS